MKQPFDLEKALAGHPLVTRSDIRATDFNKTGSLNPEFPYSFDVLGAVYYCTKDGRGTLDVSMNSVIDLFLYVPDQPEPTNDNVKHPTHYTRGKIEVIDFIQDQKLNYARGNAIKYIIRAGLKNPATTIEDLEKAKQYIDFEINDLNERTMTPEQIEMAKVIAEYDGWKVEDYQPVHGRILVANDHERKWVDSMPYLTSLDWLHPVAMRLIDDIKNQLEIVNTTWRDRYLPITELNRLAFYIEQGCAFPKGDEGYTALFESCYNAITFLNKLKSEQ